MILPIWEEVGFRSPDGSFFNAPPRPKTSFELVTTPYVSTVATDGSLDV